MSEQLFGETKKRRKAIRRIWWCKEHRAEMSYSDDRGLEMCWKLAGLVTLSLKPCRKTAMQLAPDDSLVIADMPSFVAVLELAPRG